MSGREDVGTDSNPTRAPKIVYDLDDDASVRREPRLVGKPRFRAIRTYKGSMWRERNSTQGGTRNIGK